MLSDPGDCYIVGGTGLVVVLIVAGIVAICGGLVYEVKNPCLEWEHTGGMTCFGDENFKQCTPTKRCVRRTDEVRTW